MWIFRRLLLLVKRTPVSIHFLRDVTEFSELQTISHYLPKVIRIFILLFIKQHEKTTALLSELTKVSIARFLMWWWNSSLFISTICFYIESLRRKHHCILRWKPIKKKKHSIVSNYQFPFHSHIINFTDRKYKSYFFLYFISSRLSYVTNHPRILTFLLLDWQFHTGVQQ